MIPYVQLYIRFLVRRGFCASMCSIFEEVPISTSSTSSLNLRGDCRQSFPEAFVRNLSYSMSYGPLTPMSTSSSSSSSLLVRGCYSGTDSAGRSTGVVVALAIFLNMSLSVRLSQAHTTCDKVFR